MAVDLGMVLGLVGVVIFFFLGNSVLLSWIGILWYRKRKNLPPGTMGWPFFGESRESITKGHIFMKERRARYGDLFKTHFLGWPTVICMDPDLIKFMLMNEKEVIVPGYPVAMFNILGTKNISAVYGPPHRTLRGAIIAHVNPMQIKDMLLPNTDDFMRSFLKNWGGNVVDIQERTKHMAVMSIFRQVTGIWGGLLAESFKEEFCKVYLGTLSLPINLPCMNYRRGLQARKKIDNILRDIIKQRSVSSNTTYGDILESLQRFEDYSGKKLTEDQVIDSIVTLTYSGLESFSTTCMMVVKYLHDNPKALQEFRREHMEIRKRKSPEDPIYWSDYKSMEFTRGVVLETLRLATVIIGVMRRTIRDVELKGFVIPKGWRILLYTREINFDPSLYPEPLTFNPWRWQDKSLESHARFLLFGGGTRQCPGKELGIVEIALFLHYLVTRYRWEEVEGGNKISTFPRVWAPNGMHFKIHNLEDSDA